MDYVKLGRTGVEVSPLCLGCMNFGGRTEKDESIRIIDAAIDAGINFIDTANVYNIGRSEQILGEALKDGKRRNIVLATKVYGRMAEGPNQSGSSRRHIMQQCEDSLRRLQTDHIDLYQIHRPSSDIPIDETLRALDDLIKHGKVRYTGTSTFAAWQVIESLWVAKELGLNRFVCEQPPYNILERQIESELLPMARTYGLGIIPWSPLGGGALTGKYKRGQGPPSGTRFSRQQQELYLRDEVFDVVEVVEKLAEEKGCTPSQLSLAWCGQQPGVTSPIIGPRTMEQFEDNMGSLNVMLNDKDLEAIDEVSTPGKAIVSLYEADFGPEIYR